MTQTILDKIKAYKLEEIAADKAAVPLEEMETRASAAPPVRRFAEALFDASIENYGLIAEIKKASPSKGLIRTDFDPAALRKDFMYDTYQVAEARSLGADCILIIMASVSDAQAQELEDAATHYGMDALIETHNAEELERALLLKSRMIGINNRNLNTFETSLDVTRTLSKHIPGERMIVCESGLNSPEDLADMARYGARSFLIGESLMRQDDVAGATRKLLANPLRPGGM